MNINTIDPHGPFLYSDSRLNVIVSAYEHNQAPPWMHRDGTPFWWNLGDLLLEHPPQKYIDLQNRIRTAPDEATQKTLKRRAFCYTPSGYFGAPYGDSKTGRTAENLLHATGLIAIDLDDKDNSGYVINFDDAISVLSKWPCIAYAGRSIRGKGFFALVAVPRHEAAEMHQARAAALIIDLAPHFKLDTACTDINRLRYYSWTDPRERYVFHYPENYERYYIPAPAPKPAQKTYTSSTARIGEASQTPWDAFNSTYTCEDVLTGCGFRVTRRTPNEIHFNRPGAKTNNTDVVVYLDCGKAKVFSTSVAAPTSGELKPFALYAFLEHAGDFSAAAKSLKTTIS